ncbi:MAG: hypothetical protein V3U10_04745 [Bacteroidota bacterium]
MRKFADPASFTMQACSLTSISPKAAGSPIYERDTANLEEGVGI